jgi:TonB family protein
MRLLRSTCEISCVLLCCVVSSLAQSPFRSAEIISAGDIQSPVDSVASGIVVVDVSLDSKGDVTGTKVLRDVPSLTSLAVSSIQSWKYRPALVDGIPQPSMLRVAFAFRPRAILVAEPLFEPLQPEDVPSDLGSAFALPGITAAAFPAYPIAAANVGAVVVQMKVGADGNARDVKLIRSYNPFNQFSIEAARKWRFRAASHHGRPVAAVIVIAFVYSQPTVAH